jgi:transposase
MVRTGKAEHHGLRRRIEAILWRHRNGATWRGVPAELGPWWMAAQTFNRWVSAWIGSRANRP